MSVKVLLLGSGGFLRELTELTTNLERGEQVQTRKFIVLKDEKGNLILVIGSSKHAYHADIRAHATKHVTGKVTICGGGKITFRRQLTEWKAVLGGASGDFGIYTPDLLNHTIAIVRALNMKTKFVWSGEEPISGVFLPTADRLGHLE